MVLCKPFDWTDGQCVAKPLSRVEQNDFIDSFYGFAENVVAIYRTCIYDLCF
jgi:hypothetical protein